MTIVYLLLLLVVCVCRLEDSSQDYLDLKSELSREQSVNGHHMYMYMYVYACSCFGSVFFPLQQMLHKQHGNETLKNEIEKLKNQITFRDEFLEVRRQCNDEEWDYDYDDYYCDYYFDSMYCCYCYCLGYDFEILLFCSFIFTHCYSNPSQCMLFVCVFVVSRDWGCTCQLVVIQVKWRLSSPQPKVTLCQVHFFFLARAIELGW